MRRLSYCLFAFSVLLLLSKGFTVRALAQTTKPESSTPTPRVEISGQQFIIHTVQKGETLYAISRQYAVSQTTIASHNPEIYYGIKTGQKLKIPAAHLSPAGQNDSTTSYLLHIVAEGENLYQLSRQFGVSVASIKMANALSSDTLRLNEVIRIPTKELIVQPAVQPQYIDYQVQRGEGLYGIARRHQVSQDAILAANPQLHSTSLGAGDWIRIPNPNFSPSPQQLPDSAKTQSDITTNISLSELSRQPLISRCDSSNAFPKWKVLNLSLILPFSVGKPLLSTSEDEVDAPSTSPRRSEIGDTRFLEFYQGLLLAIERQQLVGRSIHLNVFDSERNPDVVQHLVNSDTLRDSHLIIGPVYPRNISIVSSYAAQRRITLVSPLSGKTPSYETNPYLFQANPSFHTQLRQFVAQIDLSQPINIILIREESIADAEMADNLQL